MPYEYKFNKEECWFKTKCKNYNGSECYKGCLTYMKFDYMCYSSLIPKAMQYPFKLVCGNEDKNAFIRLNDIKTNIVEWVSGGYNLLIHSDVCGNGKTSWAIRMMLNYFTKVLNVSGLDCKGVYVNITALLARNKKAITLKDEELQYIYENIKEADLVIWDDIGVTELTKYEYDMLFELINDRLIAKKSNIYTTNADETNMISNVGERLTSRIYNSELVTFVGKDRRRSRVWSNSK